MLVRFLIFSVIHCHITLNYGTKRPPTGGNNVGFVQLISSRQHHHNEPV